MFLSLNFLAALKDALILTGLSISLFSLDVRNQNVLVVVGLVIYSNSFHVILDPVDVVDYCCLLVLALVELLGECLDVGGGLCLLWFLAFQQGLVVVLGQLDLAFSGYVEEILAVTRHEFCGLS